MMSDLEYTTISLPKPLLKDIKAYVDGPGRGRYRSKTELCIEAIRRHLRELESS